MHPHDLLREKVTRLRQRLSELSADRYFEDSPLRRHIETVEEFLEDRANFTDDEVAAEWTGGKFKSYYESIAVTSRLSDVVIGLGDLPGIKSRLKVICAHDLVQDLEPNNGKDYFFELELGLALRLAGLTVQLKEPDLVVAHPRLSGDLGIACKYPSSSGQLHDRVSEGYAQLERLGMEGVVALGLEQVVWREVYGRDGTPFSGFMDFRAAPSGRHPVQVLQSVVDSICAKMVEERTEKYPSEDPINGALFTCAYMGIWGEPVVQLVAGAAAFQASPGSQLASDLAIVVEMYKGAMNQGTT